MELPSFESYFSLLKVFAFTIGLHIFKPVARWKKLDWSVMLFGYVNVFLAFYGFVCFVVRIYRLLQRDQFFLVIAEVPGTLWSGNQCLNYIVILRNKAKIVELMRSFEDIYDLKWGTMEGGEQDFVGQLRKDKRRVLAYFKFYILNNLLFSLTPPLITVITYHITGVFSPVFIAPTNFYPFDRERYYWSVFFVEFLMARASMVVLLLPDVMVSMFSIQLVYHFECLGVEVCNLNMNREKMLLSHFRSSLIRATCFHQRLLE